MGLVLDLAKQFGLTLPVATATRAATAAAVAEHGDEDLSVLVKAARAAR